MKSRWLLAGLVATFMPSDARIPRPAPWLAAIECPNPTLGAADLACTVLVPTPDLDGVSAVLQLGSMPTPFGVAVTVDGRPRQRLIATIGGLPAPSSLGDYSVYVAWAYTIALDSAVRLGVVSNGRSDLGELDYTQFRILISAERSGDVAERAGRLVLRGTSPSARLMAHRDIVSPAAPGIPRPESPSGAMAAMARAGSHAPAAWPMVPTQGGMSAMPGMSGLVPDVAPFRPNGSTRNRSITPAERGAVVAKHDGDTLTLTAGLVTRTIGGQTFTMYAFNHQFPGPLIQVDQGATLVVRFRNRLDQPSDVHWHGVRLDNRFDGVDGVTQRLVPPGGAFTYRVHFPDAGIYWYHPHHREDVQQDLGLYGNIRVRSPNPSYFGPVNREETLILDDLLVDHDGVFPHGVEGPTHALMGRFGNVMLVNGEPRYSLALRTGEIVRFFLTNASSARVFNVSFGGSRMKVVASDGGKFEREAWVPSVVVAPAERYVVEVAFATPGVVPLVNRVQALDHMRGTFALEVDTLGLVGVAAAPASPSFARAFETLRVNADVEADIARLRPRFDRPVDHTVELSLRPEVLPVPVSNMLWGINTPVDWNDGMPAMNWITTSRDLTWVLRDRETGRENMDIAWRFRRGDVVKIRFVNDPSASHAMDHPIHVHGQRFLVLSRDGVPSDNLVWKDTAIIPAGETVDVLVEMSNPGKWMLHCHIAEHLEAGMMAVFTVADTGR